MVINDDVFTGTISASTPLSTQIRFVFVITYNMKTLKFHIITNTNLISVDNGVDAETVPVNTSSFITIKDAFY